jgi:hypothetical protein
MTITVLLDPAQLPDQSQDQLDFDNKMSGFMRDLPTLANQINDTEAGMNLLQAGGAYAIRYVFDTATADADPGAGKMRLSSATQNASTTMRLDLTAGGQDYTTLIDTFDSSTSAIKGSIRLVKQGDMSKWMTFDITARAAPTGYRNLTVVCTDSSSASPFANGDAVLLFFQRTGDKGETGSGAVALLASTTLSAAVANIDFLNVFSSTYDRYTIEVQGLRTETANQTLCMRLAVGGVAAADSYRTMAAHGQPVGGSGVQLELAGLTSNLPAQASNATIEVRNANASTLKSVGMRGVTFSIPNNGMIANMQEGGYAGTSSVSGFRLFLLSGGNFLAGATIRIYGHRNTQ